MRRNPNTHPAAAGALRGRIEVRVAMLLACSPAFFGACTYAPERHITAAPMTRLGQPFEVTPLVLRSDQCRIRTRLTGPGAVDAWITTRNSAVHAARRAALACCESPSVLRIEDWMAGFAAWEVTFTCPRQSPSVPP